LKENTIAANRKEILFLGFACGFAFDSWWWESSFYGLTIAYWIALTMQVGGAHFKTSNDAKAPSL
jgi:hypothetical protein